MPIVSDAPVRDWLVNKMYPNYRSMNQQAVGQGDAREKRVDTADTYKYQELLGRKPDEAADPAGYQKWLEEKQSYDQTSLEDFDAAGGKHVAVGNTADRDAKTAIADALSQKDLNRVGENSYTEDRQFSDKFALMMDNASKMPDVGGLLNQPDDKAKAQSFVDNNPAIGMNKFFVKKKA